MVEGGLSEQQVTAISAHKSMQMRRRYTHLRAEDLVEELEAIAKGKRLSKHRPLSVNEMRFMPM
ncbi:hypothetical protein [Vibrio sp. ABG19]|uniref:hypothetical protein n=1 Tax=Vibrio sp. ABG19 TaxID=2817385 RepID=UPI00249F8EB7|nr:hypothetical protein [Vibrio sp. ABG19]